MTDTKPFELDDIEDVRIIIKAKGKHYAIIDKDKSEKEENKLLRILAFKAILVTHAIVDKPLEDIQKIN